MAARARSKRLAHGWATWRGNALLRASLTALRSQHARRLEQVQGVAQETIERLERGLARTLAKVRANQEEHVRQEREMADRLAALAEEGARRERALKAEAAAREAAMGERQKLALQTAKETMRLAHEREMGALRERMAHRSHAQGEEIRRLRSQVATLDAAISRLRERIKDLEAQLLACANV